MTGVYGNVREQVGYCGIWCGSCAGGNGAVVELTRLYEEAVKRNRLDRWAPRDFDFGEFMKGLASIQAMGLCPGCREGGGNPRCHIRACSRDKGMENCSGCESLDGCVEFEELEKAIPTVRESLKEISGADMDGLIDKWEGELKGKWPHCLLFCRATGNP